MNVLCEYGKRARVYVYVILFPLLNHRLICFSYFSGTSAHELSLATLAFLPLVSANIVYTFIVLVVT